MTTSYILLADRITKYVGIAIVLLFVLPIMISSFVGQYIGFTFDNYNSSLALLAGIFIGLPALLIGVFFSNLATYWLICAGTLVFAFMSLGWGNYTVRNKILILFLIIFVITGMIAPYHPAVQPSSGYFMLSATQPALFERGLKNLQVFGEVKPCAYELIGWDRQSLYYEKICGSASQFLQFNPTTSSKITLESDPRSSKELIIHNTPHTKVLTQFQAVNIKPISAEFPTRELSLRGNGMISPDGKWLAIVARHVYGPEDVLLLRSID